MAKVNLQLKNGAIKQLAWLLMAIVPIIGSLVYFFYSFNKLGLVLTLLISVLITVIVLFYLSKEITQNKEKEILNLREEGKKAKSRLTLSLVFLFLSAIFIALCFKELFLAMSSNSLISPWQVIALRFFLFYFLALFSLFLALINKSKKIRIIYSIFLIVFYFLSFSVCLIVYHLGYGFDPFIHQASLEFIAEHGQISPKTPYYLGHYSLVIVLHKLLGISISLINKILVPLLAAISLPLLFLGFLKKFSLKDDRKNNIITSLAIMLLGFSCFIVSTPQNLSYIFLIASIIFLLKEKSLILGMLFTLATIAIHPLAGLPALILLCFVFHEKYRKRIKNRVLNKLSSFFLWTFALFSIPLSLFIANGKSISLLNVKEFLASNLSIFFNFSASNKADVFLNFSYFLKQALPLIILIAIVTSIIFFFKKYKDKKDKEKVFIFKSLLLTSISLTLTYFFVSLINFQDLIVYEQSDYAKRILITISILALPFLLIALNYFIEKINKQNNFTKIVFFIFLSISLTSSLYLSYPRIDKYDNTRGYSTSIKDLEAVRSIEKQSKASYFVLANQQVSAAALKVFGFERYLKVNNKELYFYPIPTGGKLYQYYLSAVYDSPSKELMLDAMNFVKTKESYLIINKYWNQSARLINEAKLEADSFWEINNEVFIFKYSQ